mgnify:CR=1 FL=1
MHMDDKQNNTCCSLKRFLLPSLHLDTYNIFLQLLYSFL